MKIDNSLKSILGGASLEDTGRVAKKSSSDSGSTPETDRVDVSSLASSLQAIEKGFADTPVVDTARVDEIKQAIANGHFTVDATKVADRLLKTVHELLSAHKA